MFEICGTAKKSLSTTIGTHNSGKHNDNFTALFCSIVPFDNIITEQFRKQSENKVILLTLLSELNKLCVILQLLAYHMNIRYQQMQQGL